MQQHIELSSAVKQALADRTPILALESTLITHGLPEKTNLETAHLLEEIVRKQDVVPATIAIVNGKIKIGLEAADFDLLTESTNILKASTRDLPYAITKKLNAGTTVAATLFCAELAGIRVFATGGIGGVHRGDPFDISADLMALSKSSLAVVCAGAKAILDIPKTLEYLDSIGVSVVGYRTDYFPAFYSAASSEHLSTRVDDITTLVQLLRTHWELGLSGSILIANPIPLEDEIPIEVVEPAIVTALQEAEAKSIRGRSVTPFLLAKVSQATEEKSLQANIQLIKNNVRLGAMIAKALTTS